MESGEAPASLAPNIPSFELVQTHFTSQVALRELLLVGVTAELCLCFKHAKELLSKAEGMDEVIQDLATSNLGGLGWNLQRLVMVGVCSMCGCLMFPERDKAGSGERYAQGAQGSSWTQVNCSLQVE